MKDEASKGIRQTETINGETKKKIEDKSDQERETKS